MKFSGSNTYAGATVISGTLNAAANGALGSGTTGTASVTVNTGGTLLLSGGATTDRIKNTAGVTLNGGAIFNTGGLSEGTRPTNSSSADGVAGMGALTLQTTTSGSHRRLIF